MVLIDELPDVQRPKVWSLKELEAARAAKARLALYDAVPSAGATESSSMDSEIAKFLPLLQDYLKRMLRRTSALCETC